MMALAGLVVLAIVVVVVLVIVVLMSDDHEIQQIKYEHPVETTKVLESPQEKLDYLRTELQKSGATNSYMEKMPSKASELQGKYDVVSELPEIRAASWLLFKNTANGEANLMRRFALVLIYYANGGAEWTRSENWNSDRSHCDWYGITCAKEAHMTSVKSRQLAGDTIIELDLHNNGVTGPFPKAIALLHDIEAVFFSDNSLSGPLDGPTLTSLSNLIALYLQYNRLTGTIPKGLHTLPLGGLLCCQNSPNLHSGHFCLLIFRLFCFHPSRIRRILLYARQ